MWRRTQGPETRDRSSSLAPAPSDPFRSGRHSAPAGHRPSAGPSPPVAPSALALAARRSVPHLGPCGPNAHRPLHHAPSLAPNSLPSQTMGTPACCALRPARALVPFPNRRRGIGRLLPAPVPPHSTRGQAVGPSSDLCAPSLPQNPCPARVLVPLRLGPPPSLALPRTPGSHDRSRRRATWARLFPSSARPTAPASQSVGPLPLPLLPSPGEPSSVGEPFSVPSMPPLSPTVPFHRPTLGPPGPATPEPALLPGPASYRSARSPALHLELPRRKAAVPLPLPLRVGPASAWAYPPRPTGPSPSRALL